MDAGVAGLVLAGGQGRRMGCVDKGLQAFRRRPLVEHVVERFRPQVGELLISVAPGATEYERFGCRLVADQFTADERGSPAGPLAGIHAGLAACGLPLLATVPCDAPLLPPDLVQRLHAALDQIGADAAMARAGTRLHPVFALLRAALLPRLERFLQSGGRSVQAWYGTLDTVEARFDEMPEAFANLNTLDDLRQLESGAGTRRP